MPEPTIDRELKPAVMNEPVPENRPKPAMAPEPVPLSESDQVCEPETSSVIVGALRGYFPMSPVPAGPAHEVFCVPSRKSPVSPEFPPSLPLLTPSPDSFSRLSQFVSPASADSLQRLGTTSDSTPLCGIALSPQLSSIAQASGSPAPPPAADPIIPPWSGDDERQHQCH